MEPARKKEDKKDSHWQQKYVSSAASEPPSSSRRGIRDDKKNNIVLPVKRWKEKRWISKVPQSRLQNQYAYIELSPRPCVDIDDVVLSHWSNNENSEEQEDLREEECDESFTLWKCPTSA